MTSPYLDQPKRDPDAAMFDVEDRHHRNRLGGLLAYLEDTTGHACLPAGSREAVRYAIDQLDKNAAARILERNRK